MYGRILVAVDGSEANKLAVDTAVNLAKTQNAKLTAICVFDIGSYASMINYSNDDTGRIEEMSNEAVVYAKEAAAKEGLDLTIKAVTGKPVDAIVTEAANNDLVVCGTHGRTGLSHALIGSVAERVVRLAPCPVLVVRDQNL